MRSRPLVLLASLVLLAAGLAACGGSSGDASGRHPFTVVLDWTPNTNHAGIYLAKARGWYRDAGLDVKIVEPGQGGSVQLLAAGKADVAVSAQEEVVPARAQGVPVVGLAAIIQHNTSSLLSLASSGITRPRDLQGHTYGGFGGQLEHALIDHLVTCDGGDPTKVKYADVGDVDYRVGLEKGFYDVVWIFDGWDKIRLADLEGVDVNTIPFIDHTDCIPDWYTPMLVTTEQRITGEPDRLQAFMDATARGYRTAMADPAAATAALTSAVPELDPKLVRRSADYLASRYADDPARWGHQDRAVWTRFVAFLADAGLIDKPIDVGPAYTNRFVDRADRSPSGG